MSTSYMNALSGLASAQAGYSIPGQPSGGALDGDDFMLLLLAQLKNQNPLEPLDDNQLMTQFTQLNSLQELQNISSALQDLMVSDNMLTASNLIGKKIEAYNASGEIIEGEVTGISLDQGQIMLVLDDQEIPLANLISVAAVEEPETTDEPETEVEPVE